MMKTFQAVILCVSPGRQSSVDILARVKLVDSTTIEVSVLGLGRDRVRRLTTEEPIEHRGRPLGALLDILLEIDQETLEYGDS